MLAGLVATACATKPLHGSELAQVPATLLCQPSSLQLRREQQLLQLPN